jgi:hypothetical protein
MHPWIAATVLGPLAVLAAWNVARAVREGVATSFVRKYYVDENPIGYSLCILSHIGIVTLGATMVLHAFGIIGDPIAAIDAVLPPFLKCEPLMCSP